jgi:hypothetical protein
VKHPRLRPDSAAPSETNSDDSNAHADDDAVGSDVDDAAAHRHGSHHDPSVHTERELYGVTTQRCRGEYP